MVTKFFKPTPAILPGIARAMRLALAQIDARPVGLELQRESSKFTNLFLSLGPVRSLVLFPRPQTAHAATLASGADKGQLGRVSFEGKLLHLCFYTRHCRNFVSQCRAQSMSSLIWKDPALNPGSEAWKGDASSTC